MKWQQLLMSMLITVVIITACSPSKAVPSLPQSPTPVIDNSLPPTAVLEAVEALAMRLNIAPGEINVRSIDDVDWPDSCLGLPKQDEVCAEMIVNGYKTVMEHGGKTYEAHTNHDGSQIRFVEDDSKSPGGFPSTSAEPVVKIVKAALASQLGISETELVLVSAEDVDWPDSCLGVQRPEESCLAAITPGYKVVFETDDIQYQVNTNADGSVYRILDRSVEDQPQPSVADEAQVVDMVKQLLAQQLGVPAEKIILLEAEAVDWPNGCLGIETPGRMCVQVITPGFRILLEYDGKTYAFHTDRAGGAIFPAIAPIPPTAEKVIVWERTEGAKCDRVEIGSNGVSYGDCGRSLQKTVLNSRHADELAYLFSSFGGFTSATKAGTIVFQGQGQQPPEEPEMRSIAEWASLIYAEAQGELDVPALIWHREGGIAGFCNDLAVSASGWATPSSCKIGQQKEYRQFRLSADELTQLYTWIDQYEGFIFEQKDDATADGMIVRINFNGTGTEKANSEKMVEIIAFAGRVYSTTIE